MYTIKGSQKNELLLITHPLGNSAVSKSISFSKTGVFETEPYKTLLREEHGIK